MNHQYLSLKYRFIVTGAITQPGGQVSIKRCFQVDTKNQNKEFGYKQRDDLLKMRHLPNKGLFSNLLLHPGLNPVFVPFLTSDTV